MQFKHVDKRLNDRERYIDTVKFRTKWLMVCAIVVCALFLLCFISALASYAYVANITNGLPGLIDIKVSQDETAQGLLTAWSAIWFIYIIVSFFAIGYMIFNASKLVVAANKMQKKYEAGRIKAWFVILLVFSCVLALILILSIGFSSGSYARSQSIGISGWAVAGPCLTIKEWMEEGTVGILSLVLIPIATLVLSCIEYSIAKRYIKKIQTAANEK